MQRKLVDSSGHAPEDCPAMSSEDIRLGKRHPCLREIFFLPDGQMMMRVEQVLVRTDDQRQ